MGYSLKDCGRAFLVLLGIKSNEILEAKAQEIEGAMKDKSREEIRQRIITGRCPHDIVDRIVKHAKVNYDYWERAAVAQVAAIYKVPEKEACAIVSEMTGELRHPKEINWLHRQIQNFLDNENI